jgi:phosphocarrier protein FPr
VVTDVQGRHSGRRPRQVVVAPLPVPALSSLLWDAAGLVTTGGSAGAHLIEVARSLGVPAVVQCDGLRPDVVSPDTVIAVDGDRGQVWWL